MKWLIFFIMANTDPFAVKTLKFDTMNECIDYVNDPSNASTLAIEVIAKAGFNDTVLSVACLTEERIRKEIDESTSA
jgi:hypothetical protein